MHILWGVGQAQGMAQLMFGNRRPKVAAGIVQLIGVQGRLGLNEGVGVRIILGTGRTQLGGGIAHGRRWRRAGQGTIAGNDISAVLIVTPLNVDGPRLIPGPYRVPESLLKRLILGCHIDLQTAGWPPVALGRRWGPRWDPQTLGRRPIGLGGIIQGS